MITIDHTMLAIFGFSPCYYFFSQNKTTLLFKWGWEKENLVLYWAVFFARGFAGALITAGFFTKVRFFFAGAASGVGSGPNFTSGGGAVVGTYRSVVISAGGSNLYGADTVGMVYASSG
jgi:hypothetical protein